MRKQVMEQIERREASLVDLRVQLRVVQVPIQTIIINNKSLTPDTTSNPKIKPESSNLALQTRNLKSGTTPEQKGALLKSRIFKFILVTQTIPE